MGPRVGAIAAHPILLREGVPLAALVAGKVVFLVGSELNAALDRTLRLATMPTALRPYYG